MVSSIAYKIVLIGLISLSIGFGLSETLDSSDSSGQQSDLEYFVTVGILHSNVYEYGFNERSNIDSPMRMRVLGSSDRVKENFVNTEAIMADLWYFNADNALNSKPDARIAPYKVNVNEEFLGFYALNNSDIRSPEDLDGKTVMMPSIIPEVGRTSVMVLEDRYDVEVELTERSHKGVKNPEAPIEALKNREADAVVITGVKRLGENKSIRGVYYPYKDMKNEFGDVALPTFFLTKEQGSINKTTEMIKAMQDSSAIAREESDRFMDIYQICNEFMVEDGEQISPMTPGAEEQLQYLMDLAYDEGVNDNRLNVSSHIVE